MIKNFKAKALIDAYIELGQAEQYDDSQIIDALTDIFNRSELEDLGYGEFIKDYFDGGEESSARKFATPDRMEKIANNALDFIGNMLDGSNLYETLSCSLGMSDKEILSAGFTTLEEYMEEKESGD